MILRKLLLYKPEKHQEVYALWMCVDDVQDLLVQQSRRARAAGKFSQWVSQQAHLVQIQAAELA